MNRSDGLLMGGVVLLISGLRRIEDNAVDMARRDLTLRVRRRFVHGRRLIDDAFALALVAVAVALLVQGIREAHREPPGYPPI